MPDIRCLGKIQKGHYHFLSLVMSPHTGNWILPAVLKCREDLFRIQILHIEDVVKESIEEEEKSGLSRTVLEKLERRKKSMSLACMR